MTVEQHRQAFLMMLAQVAGSFDRLIDRGELYTRLDQLNYHQLALYVDDADGPRISAGLQALLEPYFEPAPGKSRIIISVISVPDA